MKDVDGLMQDICNSIANALELHLSFLYWPIDIYNICHELYTQLCFVLFGCGYITQFWYINVIFFPNILIVLN